MWTLGGWAISTFGHYWPLLGHYWPLLAITDRYWPLLATRWWGYGKHSESLPNLVSHVTCQVSHVAL
jgi:hypothetical protein